MYIQQDFSSFKQNCAKKLSVQNGKTIGFRDFSQENKGCNMNCLTVVMK